MQTVTLDIARNMLYKLHLGLDVVQQATGLTKEELTRLQTDKATKKVQSEQ